MKTVSKENIIDSTNSLSLDSITAPDGDDTYDPHDHRSVKNATTNWQTFAHFLKASIGTGVLAMPSAFANAGYVNGVVLTAIIGFIAVHCLHILMGSMYELCKRKRVPYLTFSEAMTVGFREGPPFFKCIIPIATPFVDGFLAFYHFGICCVYVVFIAESIKQIVDEHLVVLDARIHMCFVLVPLFLIFSIRNLKLLAPFSSFANVLLFVGFGVILFYIFDDLPPISERKAVEDLGKLPIFFGTVLFALEAVGVILAIEENMKTPKSYLKPFGILNMGMAIVLSLYVVLGFFGYWKYGDASLGSVTLNIPQEKILAQVTKILFAITTWISYALQGYVTADIIWNKYLSKRVTDTSKHVLYELLIRALLVLLTFCCAIAIPDLSLFLSLVGSFCLSILGLICPALLQICVQYRTGYGPWKIRLTKNILLVAFGCLGGVVGTYVSIVEIVQAYSKTVSKENIIDSTNSLSLDSITAPDGDDKYDPHDHRSVKNATTNWQTFAHFLKASIGTGVLAMPSAFANAGYVNGVVLTAIIGFIAVHCLHILMGSMYELCKRKRVPYLTFSEAMTVGFREGPPFFKCIIPIATPFVDGFLAFYHFGICCVYVVFIAESIKQIVDEHLVVLDARIHMCFVLVPLFLIFSIRNLKLLAPFSSFANVLLFVGFGVILYYIFDDLPPISERKAVEDLGKLPIFFGTVLFALEAVGVILAIEENMKTPKSYLKPFGILNMGMAIVLSLYVVLGFFGYWKYGDASLGSVTLNIPQEKILAQVTKILFAITTWISYALQGYVTADIIWNKYLSKRVTDTSKHVLYELLIRALLVLLTFCCAIAIPDLSLFLSLVGSFCLSILGLIFPALLQICVQYRTGYGPWKIRLTKNILLVAFGCLGGVVGTYVSIVEIVQAYSKTVSKENIIDSTNSLSLGSITAPEGEDKYDPHDHRSVKNATTNWQTFAHFLKASIGTGVLAMPSAFANAGYVNGFVLTAIIGFIAVHCLHILMGSMYELCKRKRVPYLTFSEAMTVGFREGPPFFKCIIPIATPFVDGFLAFYHFGICCVYVVFIAESIKQIVDEHLVVLDARIHMCFVLVPLFLIFSIRNLKLLAPFSSFANVLLFVGFGVILYYIFDDLPPISERKAVEDLGKLPIFFGTVLFALEGVGVILAIEENMKTPKSYLKPFGILNMGMAIVLSLYVVLGFFGYWKYGDASLGSVTLNIPQEKILAQVTKILFAITTWISYALQGYVTAHIIWNKYLSKRVTDTSKHVLYELLIRALLVLLTFCCAIAIPDLSLFLSLVGSFCLSILGLICPALLQICVQYRTGYGPWKIRLTKNILLVAFGCLGGVVGTYVSIVEIVQAYSK